MKKTSGEKIRKTGINIIGDAPWGTHFCQFYQIKEDLIDILVPYFKAGLENNEFCMWVTSEPLTVEEAKAALKKKVKNLDSYIKKGQIEILDYSQWYTKTGKFNSNKVLQGWVEKEKKAIKKGFDGLRLTGNTFWLEKRDWKNFADYEAVVNRVIGKHKMLAICSYSLDKCGASEIIDVVKNHQFALIRRKNKWELIESIGQKKVKEELQKSEEMYRNLVNNSNDVICRADKGGNWTFLSPSVKRILGYEPEEMIGRSAFDFMFPEDIASTRKAHKSVVKEGRRFWEFENRWISKDGKIVTLAWNVVALRDEDGNITGTQGVGRDTTERKKAEEELKKISNQWQTTFDSMGDLVFILDKNQSIVRANKITSKFLGKPLDNIIGKKCYQLFHGRSSPVKDCLIKKMEISKKRESLTLYLPKKDLWVNASTDPILDDKKNIIGAIHIIKNVTKEKKAEEVLKESEEKFRDLFENANDLIQSVDKDGNFVYVNKKWKQILGYSDKDLKKLKLTDILRKDQIPHCMEIFKKVCKGQSFDKFETVFVTKNGKEIIVSGNTNTYFKDNKFIATRGIFRDITESKKAEEEIRKKTEELERFSKFAVGRELKMVELKKEVNELCKKLREKPRYSVK